MEKIIFISHIHEEIEIAQAIKDELNNCFQDAISVYLSETIPFGDDWQKSVNQTLRHADLILVLFSPDSIERPWINVEAGYGIISGKQVITMYCLGLDQDKLHYLYQRLKGIMIEDSEDVRRLLIENIERNVLGRETSGITEQHVNSWQASISKTIKSYLRQQIIKVKLQPLAYFHIFNDLSNTCLDIENWSKEIAAPIIGFPIHGGNNQLWQLKRVDDYKFSITSRYSEMCLEVGGEEIKQNKYNGSDNQQWDLAQVSPDNYKISPKGQPKQCLTIKNTDDPKVCRIVLCDWGHRLDQKWVFKITATVSPLG